MGQPSTAVHPTHVDLAPGTDPSAGCQMPSASNANDADEWGDMPGTGSAQVTQQPQQDWVAMANAPPTTPTPITKASTEVRAPATAAEQFLQARWDACRTGSQWHRYSPNDGSAIQRQSEGTPARVLQAPPGLGPPLGQSHTSNSSSNNSSTGKNGIGSKTRKSKKNQTR